MVGLIDLPLELWALVASDLPACDIVQACSTCKKLNNILRSDLIWEPKIKEKWGFQKPEKSCSCYEFFGELSKRPAALISSIVGHILGIEAISSDSLYEQLSFILDHTDAYFSIVVSLSLHLPEGDRLSEEGGRVADARLKNLQKVYIAAQLLDTMRLVKFFETVHQIGVRYEIPKDPEDAMRRLCLINPRYYENESPRSEFYESILQRYRNTNPTESSTTTSRVKALGHTLLDFMFEGLNNRDWEEDNSYEEQVYFEDEWAMDPDDLPEARGLDIERSYRRESLGTPLVLASILQKLCQTLGFPTKQHANLIEVTDDTSPDGKIILKIDNKGVYNDWQPVRNYHNETEWPFELDTYLETISHVLTKTQILTRNTDQNHLAHLNDLIFSHFGDLLAHFVIKFESPEKYRFDFDVHLQRWVDHVFDYRLPFLGLGLVNLFKDKPEMSDMCDVLMDTYQKKCDIFGNSAKIHGKPFPLDYGKHGNVEVGAVVKLLNEAGVIEPAVILGFVPEEPAAVCLGLSSSVHSVHISSLDDGPVDDTIIRAFAWNDYLGSWFSHFSWGARKFELLKSLSAIEIGGSSIDTFPC